MLISVFLEWEMTLIKFKSSFSPKARNKLLIIDWIIEDTRFFVALIDFSLKLEQKKSPDFHIFTSDVQNLCAFCRLLGFSQSFQDNSCYEKKNNAKETIDEMQSTVNRGY